MARYSCYAPECTRRSTCTLWHNAQKQIEAGHTFISVVNPRHIEAQGGYDHCPQYHEWKLRAYARGMRWYYGQLTGDAQTAIHRSLERHFGKSLMGRMRRGDEMISPEDQEVIRSIFARYAPDVAPEFLAIEMHHIKPHRRQ